MLLRLLLLPLLLPAAAAAELVPPYPTLPPSLPPSLPPAHTQVPIRIRNAHLVKALMADLKVKDEFDSSCDRLDLAVSPVLEKTMRYCLEAMEQLREQQMKFQYYERDCARLRSRFAMWQQKRRQENEHRRANGEEPLPEDDPSFKVRSFACSPATLLPHASIR